MKTLLTTLLGTAKQRLSEKRERLASTSWYSERYQLVTVQRNCALLILFIAVCGIILCIFTILKISSDKSIDPFVVEIEEKSGISTVIRPFIQERWTTDESLRRYFLLNYVHAREEYDFTTFNYNYFTTVRVMSLDSVYAQFRNQIYATAGKSPITLGEHGKVEIKIRSVTHLRPPKENSYLAQVIFVKNTISHNKTVSENKVALVGYEYSDLNMKTNEREINPLGFRVTSYKLDDYTL